jgi:2'-5' RNA ligase
MSAMADEPSGAMVALIPDETSRAALMLAGGEAPGELHLTMTYLGDDAAAISEERRLAVLEAVRTAAGLVEPVTARVFGHATFNPDGHAGREPCAVYLIGEAPLLDGLRSMFDHFADGEQFAPYVPHVTAGYGRAAADLSFVGPVVFDALRVAIGETSTDIPLTGSPATEKEESVEPEVKRAVSSAEREKLAKQGQAMPDESYPMKTIGDLANAIKAYGRCPEEKRPALRKLIVRNAQRLKAMNMVPKDWPEVKSLNSATADDFTAGVLLGLAGLLEADILELKAGPPGATYPSPDPGAAKLRAYWTRGEGAAKIKWGAPGDFKRCVKHMRKYVGARAEGLCNIYHRSALGVAPGKEHKNGPLWVADAEAPGGWRADYPAWRLDLDEAEPEVKASAASYAELDDDEVMRRLDGFAAMADTVAPGESATDGEDDTEEVYEASIGEDIEWQLQPDGTLENPEEEGEEEDADSPASLFDWMNQRRATS